MKKKEIMRDIEELKKIVENWHLKKCPSCGNNAEFTFQECGSLHNPDGVIMAHLGCKTFKCLQVMPQQIGLDSQLVEMARI